MVAWTVAVVHDCLRSCRRPARTGRRRRRDDVRRGIRDVDDDDVDGRSAAAAGVETESVLESVSTGTSPDGQPSAVRHNTSKPCESREQLQQRHYNTASQTNNRTLYHRNFELM